MFRSFRIYWSCVTGPSLYRVPNNIAHETLNYSSNGLEKTSSSLVTLIHSSLSIIKWTFLFWSPWAIRKLNSFANILFLCKYISMTLFIYGVIILLQGFGRFFNSTYNNFISLYELAKDDPNETVVSKLTLYAFDSIWPAQFDVRKLPEKFKTPKKICPKRSSDMPNILSPLAWLVARTIGIRLAYPGCTGILNGLTLHSRLVARDELRRLYGIRRTGLLTRDGDFVEAFYADRRGSNGSSLETGSTGHGDSKGEILVICCEGNGGYPETGIPTVPLAQGYSVLAWNHPGFGQSTGLPFPEKEQNAMEAAILFGVNHLHFKLEQIYLYGWSIGGYTASWGGMNFPEIGAIILDATFDNIDELSKRIFPSIFDMFVDFTIKTHMDLNNLGNLVNYDGPVSLIRRSDDEVISTGERPSRATNQGNLLVIGLLKYRYPHLFSDENERLLHSYLSLSPLEQNNLLSELNCSIEQYGSIVVKYLQEEYIQKHAIPDTVNALPVSFPNIGLYPSNLGKQIKELDLKRNMLLYLVSQYYSESPGFHCTPLSSSCFRPPWSPFSTMNSPTSSTLSSDQNNLIEES